MPRQAKPLPAAVLLSLRDGKWKSQTQLGKTLRDYPAVYRSHGDDRARKVADAINRAAEDGSIEWRLRGSGRLPANEYRLTDAGHDALEAYLDD